MASGLGCGFRRGGGDPRERFQSRRRVTSVDGSGGQCGAGGAQREHRLVGRHHGEILPLVEEGAHLGKDVGSQLTAFPKAIAIAAASRVLMLEHSIYSVISPEGCASILWKDAEKMREAAHALKLTAQDLKKLDVIDRIIPEPMGGAQRAPAETIAAVGDAIAEMLAELDGMKPADIVRDRRQKFLAMGSKALA